MEQNEATGLIRFIKTPQGQAPEEVREAWVGLTVPCYPNAGVTRGKVLGVVTLSPVEDTKPCGDSYTHFIVPQAEALEILERSAPVAAAWWKAHGYPHPFLKNFTFRTDEAEIVSGVTLQATREMTDEMMGDPNR